MKYGQIDGFDKDISRIVFGTIMLSEDDIENSYKLLDDMYSLGINAFDTAAVYPNDGEAVLIGWASDRGIRENVVILSKCGHQNKWRKRVTHFDILYDINNYLAKPGADYVDIYMLHRDDVSVNVGDILETLNELVDKGSVKIFGASNWGYDRIQEANEYAYKKGLQTFAAISPQFSLAEEAKSPWGEDCVTLTGAKNSKIREIYKESKIPIFAYSSLGRGMLSGNFKSNELEKANKILEPEAKIGYFNEPNIERLKRLEILADKKRTTVPCLAMSWILSHELNIYALVATSKKSRMEDNIKAFDIELSEEERNWLNLNES